MDGERQQEVGLSEDPRPPLVVLYDRRRERQRLGLRANIVYEGKTAVIQYWKCNIFLNLFQPFDRVSPFEDLMDVFCDRKSFKSNFRL